MKPHISEIQIRIVKQRNGLVGFASCLLDGNWFVGDLAIYDRVDGSGYRIVYPAKKLPNGQKIQFFHPVNKVAGNAIEDAIAKEVTRIIV